MFWACNELWVLFCTFFAKESAKHKQFEAHFAHVLLGLCHFPPLFSVLLCTAVHTSLMYCMY